MASPDIFTLPQVAKLADVEYRTLHTWVRRGLLPASRRASTGTGSPGLYDAGDVGTARRLGRLRKAGLDLHGLKRALEEPRKLRAELEELL